MRSTPCNRFPKQNSPKIENNKKKHTHTISNNRKTHVGRRYNDCIFLFFLISHEYFKYIQETYLEHYLHTYILTRVIYIDMYIL